MKQIIQTKYLEELKLWKDVRRIKIITGVRRSGKTTILRQFIEILKKEFDIRMSQIFDYDFNNPKFLNYTYMELYDEIVGNAIQDKTNYVFLDEIQDIPEFEKCVIGLFEHRTLKFDIYISSSNSRMFSEELATLFTGRGKEIKILPLSFKQYYEYVNNISELDAFKRYMKYGGLPLIVENWNNDKMVEDDLSMVFNDSVTKDIKFRHSIGNYTNFKNIAKYVFEHIAQYISIHNLVSFINANNKTKISYNTIARYLEWMQEALLLYKCQVYNFVEKKVLQTTSKYYSVDTGIRNSESKFKNINSGFQLENVIYLELKRRGYEVHVGKLRNGEIDFVAEKSKETLFIQVTEKIDWDQVTEKIDWDEKSKNYKREIGTLEVIKINEPKIVLSLFDLTQKTNTGIKVMNVIDWLLEKE